jgi:cysteine desulfurase
VQAAGKMALSVDALGVDLLSVSAHKLGGPAGAGALIVRDGLALEPLVHGGGQELRRRAGTENLAAIAGFAAAAQEKRLEIKPLRDHLEEGLEGAVILSGSRERLPNTTCFAIPGISAETLLMALDLAGFAVSSGSACSSGKVAKSHVLAAMGVTPDLANAAVRVSLGWTTTAEDIEQFISALARIKARRKAA